MIRLLLDAAVEACGADPAQRHVLIASSSVDLAAFGVGGVMARAGADGWRCEGAHGNWSATGLQTLILAGLSGRGEPVRTWVLDGWTLIAASGAALDLRGAVLRGAQLRGARLLGARLEEADFTGADLEKADLSRSNASGASFAGANLFSASFHSADLTETDLSRANLRHVDFRGATCRRTAFGGADLWNAYLWNVDLADAFVDPAAAARADHLNELLSDRPGGVQ